MHEKVEKVYVFSVFYPAVSITNGHRYAVKKSGNVVCSRTGIRRIIRIYVVLVCEVALSVEDLFLIIRRIIRIYVVLVCEVALSVEDLFLIILH